jgi:hypothetical protein
MNTTAIARLAAILSPVAAAVAAALAIGVTGATGTAATPSASSGGSPAVQTAETGTREHWYYDYTRAPVVQGDDVGNVPGTNCRNCVRDAIEAYAYGQLQMPAGTGNAYYDAYCASGADGGASGANENNGLWTGPGGDDPSAIDGPEYAAGLWGYGSDPATVAFFTGGVCSRFSMECFDDYGYCDFQQPTNPCPNDDNVIDADSYTGPYHYGLLEDADGDGYCDEDTYVLVCTGPVDGGLTGGAPPISACSDVYGDDCDDTYGSGAAFNPAATEICDTYDNDCDNYIDDADGSVTGQSTWYDDGDGDQYGDATDSYGPSC